MSAKQASPLSITPKPSVRLKYLLNVAYLFSLIAVFANLLPIFYKAAFILALAISYVQTIGKLGKIGKKRYTLQYDEASGWKIAYGLDAIPVIILPTTVITVYAIFLHLEITAKGTNISRIGVGGPIHTKRKNLLIMADSLNDEDYRNLTVKLKTTWGNKSNPATS